MFGAHVWPELRHRLLDIQDTRLAEMDRHGIEMMILSLNAPAVQAIHDVKTRDRGGQAGQRRAGRACAQAPRTAFAAFAALPMQDPDAATDELARCVKQLGFVGALVNGFSQAGQRRTTFSITIRRSTGRSGARSRRSTCRSICTRAIRCQAGPSSTTATPWLLGPNWAFSAETSVHALRLIGSGLFDECPRLKIVLGHLGEGIPVQLWRIDGRNGWMKAKHKYAAKQGVGYYFRKHFHLTTSGNFHTPSLVNVVGEMGAERVMFSVDWPFESVDEGAEWFDNAEIGADERRKIGRDNAIKLFKH